MPMYQQINLYQPIFRKQRQIFSAITMLQSMAVVAAALLAIYAYGTWKVTRLEAEVALLEGREATHIAQLSRVDPSLTAGRRAELDAEIDRLGATLLDQQRLVEQLREQPLGGTRGFSEYLAALGRQHTPQLWLTGFAVNGGTGAIELAGRSVSAELVPEYLQRLARESALVGQRFDRFEIERDAATGEAVFHATSRAASAVRDGEETLARREP
jgi:Tfp pilus assembly protein PilN